jgi:uncharacterized protein DUF6088
MKPPANTAQAVRAAVARARPGEPFASRKLMGHGPHTAVQRELSRLAKAGTIRRIAHGIFVRPERSRHVHGEVPPELSKVAKALAERTGAVIQVHGAEAALRMGLTTQVPMQTIFQTSGPSKSIKVGNRIVQLKHASSRKLALAGRPAGVALAALWYLGKAEVAPSTFEIIRRKLGPAEFMALAGARAQMPAWMAEALDRYQEALPPG